MKIALLGTGTMGRAIAAALAGTYTADEEISVIAFDKSDAVLKQLPDDVLVIAPDEWAEKENCPDVIILATKPQDLGQSLEQFKPLLHSDGFNPLWVSIAAGVSIQTIQDALMPASRICRVMPNTPLVVGRGMAAFSLNAACTDTDRKNVHIIFSSCGETIEIPEKSMNAVTGLSGSGPAYVYLFVEALIEGGVAAGLPYQVARDCAVQTVAGAVEMVRQNSGIAPAQLKAQVMSPGGTTVCGLATLEKNKFKFAVMQAVTDAAARAGELGRSTA